MQWPPGRWYSSTKPQWLSGGSWWVPSTLSCFFEAHQNHHQPARWPSPSATPQLTQRPCRNAGVLSINVKMTRRSTRIGLVMFGHPFQSILRGFVYTPETLSERIMVEWSEHRLFGLQKMVILGGPSTSMQPCQGVSLCSNPASLWGCTNRG